MDVLDEARTLVCGPRRHHYGDPRSNFQNIAAMWNAYMANKPEDWDGQLNAYDVSQLMILLKISRGARGYHRDSVVDTCGYAVLAEVICDDEAYEIYRLPVEE
jgi:hypothetical protein